MAGEYRSRMERRQARQKKARGKHRAKDIAKKVFLAFLLAGFLTLVGGIVTFAVFVSDAPELDPQKLKVPLSSKIYDMDNNLIEEIGTEKRDWVEFDEIPELVKNAILATEDARFFEHSGIDLIRLGGAVISNITNGFGSQGASTITQQVVKMSFLSNEKTLKRKAQEAWLAFQLERAFTKEEIFELYVNKVNMGGNIYGIKKAAKTYFNKDLDELTLPEAALIAGLPQRPNAYNPFVNPDLADQRKNTVLKLMNQHGFISNKEMKEAQNTPISTLIANPEETVADDSPYDSFIDQIIDEVEEMGYNAYTDGLEIYTTMDPKAQEMVYKILNTNDYVEWPNDKIQSGVILLDTKTGEIRAIGGGRNQTVRRGLNYAFDIKRQPGSTAKPILAYGPAIEYLHWSTYQIIDDSKHTYSNGQPVNNFDNRYVGEQTLRYHLMKSRNVPAVKAIQAVGTEKAQEFAEKLGIPFYGEPVYESYAIGGFNKGIAPIHLAGAYAAFGNGGVYNKPHAIRKIVLSDGVTKIHLTPDPVIAMSDYTAFMISDVLKDVLSSAGTGASARVSGVPIAGKTGTSNYTDDEIKRWNLKKSDSPDSWFVGYSTNYTTAVWVGYKDRSHPVDNSKLPQEVFRHLMAYVHKNIETPDFQMPASVVKLGIVKGSNPPKLASPFTPEDQIVYEYFVKGYEPKETGTENLTVPPVGNLSVNYDSKNNKAVLNWDYANIQGIQFEVYVSIEGSADQLVAQTDKTGLNVENVAPGLKYTFTVYATYDGKKSEPKKAKLDLSALSENPGENPGNNDPSNNPSVPNNGNDGGPNNNNGNSQNNSGGQNNGGGSQNSGNSGPGGTPERNSGNGNGGTGETGTDPGD